MNWYNEKMDTPIVIKRDGSEEPFEKNKIKRVLIAAGMAPEEAEEIANKVERWIQKNNMTKFKSLELRDKILSELQDAKSSVANLYQWYESTKDR